MTGLQIGALAHAATEAGSPGSALFRPGTHDKITVRPHPLRDSDIVVRGRVTDVNGDPLIGVNIKVKGTSKGASTDPKGGFFLTTSSENNVLVFSYVGYITREITVAKTQTLNVQLATDPKSLNEVVVTALGIKREEKSLGYAATVVKGDQLTEAVSGNWTDALSGKVAGVNLVRSNSGPTGSNKIILRGENNLTGENDALIVVDGVVINHGSGRKSAISGESAYGTGSDNMPADYGSGLNDINPEDIESLTVLKGPARRRSTANAAPTVRSLSPPSPAAASAKASGCPSIPTLLSNRSTAGPICNSNMGRASTGRRIIPTAAAPMAVPPAAPARHMAPGSTGKASSSSTP